MVFELIGWLAVVLTQVFYIPNTIKILRTHDVQGYSVTAWAMLFVGLGCYLVYFASRGDVVGIAANVCGMAGSGLTLGCIWIWRDRSQTVEAPDQPAAAPSPSTLDGGGAATPLARNAGKP